MESVNAYYSTKRRQDENIALAQTITKLSGCNLKSGIPPGWDVKSDNSNHLNLWGKPIHFLALTTRH